MIQFQNVSKIYPRNIIALDDVSFEIHEGEFVFLVGPSGSGKTTIIKMLIREEEPSGGKIYFDDEDVTRYSRNAVYHLRRKIGVIFQDYKLIEDKTAFENIAFVMEAAGQSTKSIVETVPYLLDIVGLADRQDAFPKELSGGEKQRVAIARALSNNPKLLIADEPTGNLDPQASWDIVQILRKINDWGTTVVMSTHGIEIVDELAKRVLRMEKGQLVQDETSGTYKTKKVQAKENFEDKVKFKTQQKEEKLKEKAKEEKKTDAVITTSEVEQKEEIKDENTKGENVEDKTNTKEESNANPEEEIKPKAVLTQKPKPKLKISLVNKKNQEKEKKKNNNVEAKVQPDEPQKEEKTAVDTKSDNNIKENTKELDDDIYKLDMPRELTRILFDNGYKTTTSLIESGIEGVKKIEKIDERDIEIIKNAITKYIKKYQL